MLLVRILQLATLLLSLNGSHAQLDVGKLSDLLKELARDGLGKDEIQRLVDRAHQFETMDILDTPDGGKQFVIEVAEKLKERFQVRSEAVREIKKAVVENYDRFLMDSGYNLTHPECCHVNEDDQEHDAKLGQGVNRHDICYRVSKDSPDDFRIPANKNIFEQVLSLKALNEVPTRLALLTANHVPRLCRAQWVGMVDVGTCSYPEAPTCHHPHPMIYTQSMHIVGSQKTMQKNAHDIERLKWQYFGSEEGIFTTFPSHVSSSCDNYDPRFRPWYVEAATPVSKDLVLVIDVSGSMDNKDRLTIAKSAAITVVLTLNPNDRIGLVRFSDEASAPPGDTTTSICYSSELAFATPENVNYLKGYIEGLKAGGNTNYVDALDKAFSLVLNTPDPKSRKVRDKAIVFLTDGRDTASSDTAILQKIADLNQKVQNKVLIMTYGLGTDIDAQGAQLLDQMANQVMSDASYGDINRGLYTEVDTTENLRFKLGSYYNQFSDAGLSSTSIVTVPYMDFFGLGLVSSICEPVHHNGELFGVACVDVGIADILGDISYYQYGEYAYTFVIDRTGRTLVHPFLPSVFDSVNDKVFLDISDLERGEGIEDVIDSMKNGESGSKNIAATNFYKGNGNVTKQGVSSTALDAKYIWQHVKRTNFSVCIVFSVKDKQVDISTAGDAEHFLFYRFDLKLPADPCNNLNKVATTESSSIKFTGHAYTDPYRVFHDSFTEDELKHMTNYMMTSNYQWKWLKHGVRDTVVLTEQMDEFWKSKNEEYGKYVIWRYIGTFNGVFRIYPGATVSHEFEHFNRPWYDEALANKDDIVMSVPYTDAFGAGTIISLMHTILEGKRDHSVEEDMSIGVIGMDFKLEYIHWFVEQTCKAGENQRCFLVDNAGFIIYHPSFEQRGSEVTYVHITKLEPDIAHYLIEARMLIRKQCLSLADKKIYHTWALDIKSGKKGDIDIDHYTMQKIPGTNLYLAITSSGNFATECNCPTYTVSRCSRKDSSHCECPCYTLADYDYCENTFPLNEAYFSTCTAPKPPTDSSAPFPNEAERAKEYPICFDVQCAEYTAQRICNSIAHCTWCRMELGESHELGCHENGKCVVEPSHNDTGGDIPGGSENNGDILGVPGTNPIAEGPGTTAAMIGGVAAAAAVVIIIIIIIIVVIYKRRRGQQDENPKVDSSTEAMKTRSKGSLNDLDTNDWNTQLPVPSPIPPSPQTFDPIYDNHHEAYAVIQRGSGIYHDLVQPSLQKTPDNVYLTTINSNMPAECKF